MFDSKDVNQAIKWAQEHLTREHDRYVFEFLQMR